MSLVVRALGLLPLNLISFVVGWLARLHLCAPFDRWLCTVFVKIFNIDMDEAEKSLEQYKTIEEVFTRKLKPGSRPTRSDLICPADGYLTCAQTLEPPGDQALQIKGLSYSLSELVFDEASIRHPFYYYFHVYLAPHNYHRVHSPLSGAITGLRYIPGSCWPVNRPFVRYLPKLFLRNERLVFEMITPNGGRFYLVMVAALNVARIQPVIMPDFVTNDRIRGKLIQGFWQLERPIEVSAGDELATFMLGSTVVCAFEKQAIAGLDPVQTTKIRSATLGESLEQTL